MVFHLQKTQSEWNHFRQSCDEHFELDHADRLESDDAVAVALCVHLVQFEKLNDARRESNLHELLQHAQQQLRQAKFRQAQELDLLAG